MKKTRFSAGLGLTVWLLLMLSSLLLAGCDKLTQYRLTEQEINQALQQRVHFARDIGLPGIADAHITLSNLQSHIGREEPNKVMLTGEAQLNLTSLFGNKQATLLLTLKTQPVFNQQQGAIYLYDLQLLDLRATPENMNDILQALSPFLSTSLRNYFTQHPAYVLNPDRSRGEALAKKYAKGIEVKPGELVIPFTL